MKFRIKIDPEDKISEFYEDNNIFDKSFYVIEDTTVTSITESSLTITFDGVEIIDGDYINSSPEILINLQYPVWFPVMDTSSLHFTLVEYKINPDLTDGEHELKISGRDRYGNTDPDASIERYFVVNSDLSLLNVYNYPNPFSDQTYFTFKLTQIPNELEIRIFTIAGRLIKILKYNSNQLQFDFNRIFWDGRDEDGDKIASGVYLYKMIIRKDSEVQSTTQKLAVIR